MKIALAAAWLLVVPAAYGTDVYEIVWSTLDGGGGVLTGDGYELAATIGQHDAVSQLTDGAYVLEGGYWVSGGGSGRIFCKADINQDDFLDFFDFDAFIARYERGFMADYNEDGFIDFFDYDAFVADFERGC